MQIVWFHLHVFKYWTISAANVENNIWYFIHGNVWKVSGGQYYALPYGLCMKCRSYCQLFACTLTQHVPQLYIGSAQLMYSECLRTERQQCITISHCHDQERHTFPPLLGRIYSTISGLYHLQYNTIHDNTIQQLHLGAIQYTEKYMFSVCSFEYLVCTR